MDGYNQNLDYMVVEDQNGPRDMSYFLSLTESERKILVLDALRKHIELFPEDEQEAERGRIRSLALGYDI
jgi:hypothetical protein